MSTKLSDLEPWLQPWAAWLISLTPYVQVTSTRRTWFAQLQLYLAAKRGESRYPALPPGRSLHEQGRAFDLVGPSKVLHQLGAIWQEVGGRWSADDEIHFEA